MLEIPLLKKVLSDTTDFLLKLWKINIGSLFKKIQIKTLVICLGLTFFFGFVQV